LIVHTASQPSHDWAVREPLTDFSINATATVELLELFRKHCPEAKFVFTSTNKVYGDAPNRLPLIEEARRFELDPSHRYFEHGIDESLSLDQATHSLFGVSKVSADLMVQEYGRYFGLATACFRAGCITGPAHAGAELHGFLAYLMNCAVTGREYTIYGYEGKQVRDHIHSFDLVRMFDHYYQAPSPGAVFNVGGGRQASCSVIEAIEICEQLTGVQMSIRYDAQNRQGDHLWWISDCRRFQSEYPAWTPRYDLKTICEGLYAAAMKPA
jgi:CDP-paratose 2-epimerase